MQSKFIQNKLDDLNLSINKDTMDQIIMFIECQIGSVKDLSPQRQLYVIYAAAGIVMQQKKVPTVDGKEWVGIGLSIEQLLSRLDKLDIQKYLECLQKVLSKYKKASSDLIYKVQQLKISYRLFCKFNKVTNKLISKMPGKINDMLVDIISVIWEMYLLIKHSQSDLNIQQQTKSIIGCIIYVFNKLQIPQQNIDYELIQIEFSCQPCQTFNLNTQSLDYLLQQFIVKRYQHYSFLEVFQSKFMRQRLLDDIRIKYQSTKNTHIPVDEIKYLKLPQNLTPLRMTISTSSSINYHQKIDFVNMIMQGKEIVQEHKSQIDVDFKNFQTTQLISPMANRMRIGLNSNSMSPLQKKPQLTPLTSKTKDVQWINAKIAQMDEIKIAKLEQMFNQISYSAFSDVKSFNSQILEKVLNSVNINPTLIQTKKTKIITLFERIILKLSCQNQNITDNYLQLADKKYIKSILCIATYIYFYGNSLPLGKFNQLCLKFQCNYIDIVYNLNKVVKNDNTIPPTLRYELKMLQNSIIMRYSWQNGSALEFIKNQEKDIQSRLFSDKLQHNIKERVFKLTRDNYKDIKHIQNTVNQLALFVVSSKQHLLQNNFIDQIIICSIYHTLLNQNITPQPNFDDIFKVYDKLENSFHQYKYNVNFKDDTLSIFDFYHNVFSKEVKQFQLLKVQSKLDSPTNLNPTCSFNSPTFGMKQSKPQSYKASRLLTLKLNKSKKKEQQPENPENSQQLNLNTPTRSQHEGNINMQLSSVSPALTRQFSFSREDMNQNSATFGFNIPK